MAKKKTKKKKSFRDRKIDINQILLKDRRLFLFDVIHEESARRLIKELIVLDKIKASPIILYINSPGGYLSNGFAIIDAMKGIRSPVITFITGGVCSMASLISVAGDKRIMSETSYWMAHDIHSYKEDYATKMIDNVEFLKEQQKQVFNFLRKHTKLSEADLNKARNGELWLTAKEAKKKGVIDNIIK